MIKITQWLAVISFTFVLVVAAVLLYLELSYPIPVENEVSLPNISADAARESELPILAFCELANNPEKYSGKIVRLKATLTGFIHGRVFHDVNCSGIEKQTAVTYAPENEKEIERALFKVRGSDNYMIPVELIAVGRFSKVVPTNNSDAVYDTASLQFEITRIETAFSYRYDR